MENMNKLLSHYGKTKRHEILFVLVSSFVFLVMCATLSWPHSGFQSTVIIIIIILFNKTVDKTQPYTR